MECNKEEAIRAKEIAEKKMQNKDFVGARRIALKAQQLYPELENVSQMLTVCDVHCSAEHKILGSEMDWYGILQITQTADEASIKKQYRKFALLLHPDKNKFAGAEAAFKLIGEAQRVLTDQQKRNLYDMKCRHSVRSVAPKPPRQPVNRNSSTRKPAGARNNSMNTTSQQFTGPNIHQQQQKQKQKPPEFPNGLPTFWTICPYCDVRYQYYRNILNRSLRCQSCTKPFIAYDLGSRSPSVGVNGNKSAFAQQKEVPGQGAKVGSQSTTGNPPSHVGSKGNFGAGTAEPKAFPKMGSTSDVGRHSKCVGKEAGNVDIGVGAEGERRPKNQEKPEESEPSGNSSKKRRRKLDRESSETCDNGSSADMEEDAVIKEDGAYPAGQNHGFAGAHYPRRSIRQKNNVTYKEDLSEDDVSASPLKRSRESGSFCAMEEQTKNAASEGGLPKTHRSATSAAAFDNDLEMETSFEGNLPNGKNETETCKENREEADVVNDSKSIESPKTMPDPEYYDYPDPDFSNFDQLRELEKFAVDQIWALYDTIDAMPRFYALIRKVYSPGFKVRITWLEPTPDGKDEIDWVEEDLPVACGRFKHGKTEDTQDQLMFSHVTTWEKGSGKNPYKIYPRKGETWALFKDWNIKWSSDPENHRNYEYEFVEVLSDYSEDTGINVVYLGKMKGFVSLFSQIKEGIHSSKIPPDELLRFSHRIPSFRMTGTEREDVPGGSYEFDPASLPTNVEVFSFTEDVKLDNGRNGSCPKFSKENAKPMVESILPDTKQNGSDQDEENVLETRNSENGNQKAIELNGTRNKPSQANVSHCAGEKTQIHMNNVKSVSFDGFREAGVSSYRDDEKRHNKVVEDTISDGITEDPCSAPASSSSSEPNEIPDTEFYEFETDKSFEKFKIGQIWALYSDLDGMPKFYGKIKKIKPEPDFKLWVTWLEACPLPKASIGWTHEDMPVCYGAFKLGNDTNEYNSTSSFSHQVKAEATGKNRYDIYPREGEVWALYKNWDAEWTVSNLPGCKYDVVEIVECNTLGTKVQVLVLVDGHKTVYKATKKRGSTVTMEIPQRDFLRFSHQVPAIQLKEEKNGSLRGCWELDPASLTCP